MDFFLGGVLGSIVRLTDIGYKEDRIGNIENAHTNGLQYNRRDRWQLVRGGEDSHIFGKREGYPGNEGDSKEGEILDEVWEGFCLGDGLLAAGLGLLFCCIFFPVFLFLLVFFFDVECTVLVVGFVKFNTN